MLEGCLSIIVHILEKVFLPNLIRLEKEVMMIYTSRHLPQGILGRRNVIYVPSFEYEEVLSLVTLRYTISAYGYG